MKNDLNCKLILLVILMTIFTGSLILIQNTHQKDITNITIELEKSKKYIITLENNLLEFEKSNIELKNIIPKLESDIEKLNSELENTNSKIKSLNTTKKVVNKSYVGNTRTFEATAYANDPITASGVVPRVGHTIAVDPRIIPLGTKVYIEGLGTFTAEDTGGAIKGNRIDIYMSSESECKNWGRRNVQLKIL